MAKKIALISALLLSFGMQAATSTSQEVLNQLVRNAHGGVEVHTINGVTSYSGYVGTGYMYYFYKEQAYVKPEISAKWGEYRFQNAYHVKTASMVLPVTVGYRLFQQGAIGMDIFGGVRYEQILYSTDNTYPYSLNNSQVGLTAGTSVRLMNKFSINASYYYGLTTLYKDGSGRVTSFSFSFNF